MGPPDMPSLSEELANRMNPSQDIMTALRRFSERALDMGLMSKDDEAYAIFAVVYNGLPFLLSHLRPFTETGPLSLVTAFRSAIVLQDEALIRELIPHIEEIHLLDAFRRSCASKNVDMVAALLTNLPARLRTTAATSYLELSVIAGKLDLIQLLITGGADLNKNITVHGYGHKTGTCLHWLASCALRTSLPDNAVLSIVKMFCDAGADLNARDEKRQTPLHFLAINGVRKVKPLLSCADFATGGIAWLYESVIQTLIDAGADVNAQDAEGRTPLHHAVVQGEGVMFNLLFKASANALIEDNDGNTASELANRFMEHVIRKYEAGQVKELEAVRELEAARQLEEVKEREAAERRRFIKE
ncbi:ankyrin [Morchella conica CCBAS932]|uniref:Ankyrin n=1 Tax=Morchella conica CCBAS932 TaxID=1392247 RepID=A0A3N4KJH1_9PEZI|nr:ankyrin [Morchella conica CCBAS932]